MFANLIEGLLRGADAANLIDFFLFVLVVLFVLSLYWKRKEQHHAFTNYTPTLLTSLGILGTFTGIILGLLEFDTNDIDKSIGPLLAGLKTAFITSLAGMLLSIVYKSMISTGAFSQLDETGLNEEEIGIGELYHVMQRQAEGIEQLKKSISENDESSLVGQIKLLRSDLTDNHKATNKHLTITSAAVTQIYEVTVDQQNRFDQFEQRLWIKLQDFADMLSKSATEQVIDALKSVIQDFNNNLIEQFGDNFKQLNEAVLKLVQWQENYKDQLEQMKLQYDQGVEAIHKTQESVTTISHEARKIPETMDKLKDVMTVNQHQIAELDRHLQGFKDIRDKAVEAVPEIRNQIDLAIAGAKEANDKLASGIVESTDKIKTVITQSADDYRHAVDQTRGALVESAQTTANASETIKRQFGDAIEDINSHMRDMVAKLIEGNQSLNESYKNAGERLMQGSEEAGKVFTSGIENMQRSLTATIEQQVTEHRQQADRVFAGLEQTIAEVLAQTGESVQKQVVMIDQTMGEEIEKVMQSMGNALAAISNKFTDDYGNLVRQMQNVVNQKL